MEYGTLGGWVEGLRYLTYNIEIGQSKDRRLTTFGPRVCLIIPPASHASERVSLHSSLSPESKSSLLTPLTRPSSRVRSSPLALPRQPQERSASRQRYTQWKPFFNVSPVPPSPFLSFSWSSTPFTTAWLLFRVYPQAYHGLGRTQAKCLLISGPTWPASAV